ncbi:MAG TPA: A24 family peptidase C-terminal domain-containing protein, partial [Candidatus Bathyarchaeia archaeon]|nr:A24 family peptidase C-terminal domain-containing protein [Candidatus Bathyarchaeia archaeon]
RFWIIYAPIAAALFIARIAFAPDAAVIFLVSAVATIVVAFLLFQFGAMGGADSKALMCIALALPIAPTFLSPLWQAPLSFYPFPIAILVNSFLLSISMMFILLGKNLLSRSSSPRGLFQGFERESILRKALVLLTSYKTSFNVLRSSSYLYPAEQVAVVNSKPVRQLHLVSSVEEERDKLVSGLEGYKDQGLFSDGVWVTPGLPHLVFMTASLVVTVVVGDLLMWLFFKAVGVS